MGRYHKFYFQNWTYDPNKISLQTPSSNETGVVFKTQDAILTANLKGTQLTQNSGAYNSSSQRKYVRTPNGKLHSVYQNMGRVWYERSNDGGQTWYLMDGGLPIDNGEGKNPSIDYVSDNGVIVAYQEKNGNYFKIKLKFFSFDAPYPYYNEDEVTVATVSQLYSGTNAMPVICTDAIDEFTIIWKKTNGFYYRNGYYNSIDELTLTGINTYINGLSSSANNLAVTATKLTGLSYLRHLVWEITGPNYTSNI